jgi:hypothetical protein
MAKQLNQGSKNNKTNPQPKFIFGVVGAFIIIFGLIAFGTLNKFRQQPPFPTPAIDPTKIALEIDATAVRNFLTSQAATLSPSDQSLSTALTSALLLIPLLTNENEGYALRYPAEYHVVFFGRSVCFTLAQTDGCHAANAILDVSDAEGRTLANAADELAANGISSVEITRTNMKIGGENGENAILLKNIYSYDILLQLVVMHNNRIYVFTFVPWVEGTDEFQRLQPLYSTLISSFTFLDKP